MKKEIWKKTHLSEDYEVSNHGRVRSLKRGKIRILKFGHTYNGYRIVSINGKTERIHRLVSYAFIGPRPNGYQTNHKNGDKSDNRPENLEWVTHADNNRHALSSKLRIMPKGENHYKARLNEQQVKQIKSLLKAGIRTCDLARNFGVIPEVIYAIKVRKSWKHIEVKSE